MKVVQVITAENAAEWELLTAHIAAQPAMVETVPGERTITTTIEGPLVEIATELVFQWQLVQSPP